MDSEKLIGQEMIELGLINHDQLEAALVLQKKKKDRIGELLLALRFVSEIDILNVLAERYRIHYISSDKLATIKIPQSVLELIPVDFAEPRFILPLMHDPDRQVLSVLANSPTDTKLLKEIQLLTSCWEVNAYLAMKPTVMAGIRKFYYGEGKAFDRLEESEIGQSPMLSFASGMDRKADITDNQLRHPGGMRLADEVVSTSLMTDNLYVETLNILISLLEMKRGAFRGHSASVARLVKRVSEHLALKPRDVYLNVVAAYFHDLGKPEGVHHTLCNLKTEKELKQAQKVYLAPVRLIQMANFPRIIPDILTHIFERVDGKGFPNGLTGDQIPIGSRIIAIVDAYEDLVRHPEWSNMNVRDILKELFNYQGNCFDRVILRALNEVVLEGQQSLTAVAGENGYTLMLIDPTGQRYSHFISRFKEAGFRMLVARDTDSAAQMLKQARVDVVLSDLDTSPLTGIQLCQALKTNPTSRSIMFALMSDSEDSAKLMQEAIDAGADDFFTRPLKAEVILARVRMRLKRQKDTLTSMQAQTTPPRASVTGNLSDISLADVVQLLTNGRKTGMLVLRRGEEEGKIFINGGRVINCFYSGKRGEPAFYMLLDWEEGEFSLETDCTMPEELINLPTENLMLEGFRLLDEARAGR